MTEAGPKPRDAKRKQSVKMSGAALKGTWSGALVSSEMPFYDPIFSCGKITACNCTALVQCHAYLATEVHRLAVFGCHSEGQSRDSTFPAEHQSSATVPLIKR